MIKSKISRILKFTIKTLNEFFFMWHHFGFAYAVYGFIWWMCFYLRPPFAYKISTFAICRKTVWLDKYITKHYADIIENYRVNPPTTILTNSTYIWVFWAQGEEQMPPLIQACYKQLCHFNSNITLVTNQNINNFINLPLIIYEKVKDGRITWANFSDIVRNTLLARYGGLWLDASVWVSGILPFDKISTMPFYTANAPVPMATNSIRFWTSFQWNWSSWCLWAKDQNYLLYSFVSDMLKSIAEREQYWPDYVIQDYLIHYACRIFPSIRQDMETMSIKNCRRGDLAAIMNQPYDNDLYRKLISTDFVFKLSFRSPWSEKTSQGEQTFYGYILSTAAKQNLQK